MAKKKTPAKAPDGPAMSKYGNLSEAERNGFIVATASAIAGRITSDQGMVSQKLHEDTVNELKGKLKKANDEKDDLKKELSGIRNERDDLQARFDNKLKAIEELENSLEEARGENRALREANGSLDKDINRLKRINEELSQKPEEDGEASRLRDKLEALRREKDDAAAKASAEKDDLENRLREATERCESLAAELEEAKAEAVAHEPSTPAVQPVVAGTVSRIDGATLRSDLFSAGRYRGVLSRDGSRITLTPDVEGMVECSDGEIRIPMLARLVPFDGTVSYEAVSDSGKVTISIRRRWRHPRIDPMSHDADVPAHGQRSPGGCQAPDDPIDRRNGLAGARQVLLRANHVAQGGGAGVGQRRVPGYHRAEVGLPQGHRVPEGPR